MTGGGQPRSVSKTSFENDLDESEMELEDVEVATSINQVIHAKFPGQINFANGSHNFILPKVKQTWVYVIYK